MTPMSRFDSTRFTVPGCHAQRRVSPHSIIHKYIVPSDPTKYRAFHPLSPVFCPGWGAVEGETPVRSLRPSPMSMIRRLYNGCVSNGCVSPRCGFGDLAFDSMRERRAGGHERLLRCHTDNLGAKRAIQKYRIETMSCRETSFTKTCYLCNTLRKRGEAGPLKAVPLLRVQKSSVIVIGRRRGASRGRPVRWFA